MSKDKNARGARSIIPEPKLASYDQTSLANEYWKPLYKLFYKHTKNHWDAEDLTQTVFLKIYAGWDRIWWDNLAGFIARIFHNAKADYFTQKFNRPSVGTEDEDNKRDVHDGGVQDPLRLMIRGEASERIMVALGKLKNNDRLLLLERVLTDKSVEELSLKYGIKTPQGVYEKISRIRKVLTANCGGKDFLPNGEWNEQYECVSE